MISVCLASYNGVNYIQQQIDSILSQLAEGDELLISDDGSTDGTLEIIKSYKDQRILLFESGFKNVVKNFEFIISKSRGEIIFLSDQDDLWEPTKVMRILEIFSNKHEIGLITTGFNTIDENGDVIKKHIDEKLKLNLFSNIIKNNFLGCTLAFRKELKEIVLPFPSKLAMHDWWIGCNAIIRSSVLHLNIDLINYRRHNTNFTILNKSTLIQKVSWRINLVINLLKRFFK